jgi:3-oxoacyl-[acyl-carrier protein] reductase
MFGALTPFEEIEESLWDQIYGVNVKGIWFGSKYVVPVMKREGGGAIVNIASMAGIKPGPLVACYASSKAAAITLTKSLALELAPHNIRVNCVNPALTDTPMADNFPDEEKKAFVDSIPFGRMASPENVAYAALYLASDESEMVTGTGINVDGGHGI